MPTFLLMTMILLLTNEVSAFAPKTWGAQHTIPAYEATGSPELPTYSRSRSSSSRASGTSASSSRGGSWDSESASQTPDLPSTSSGTVDNEDDTAETRYNIGVMYYRGDAEKGVTKNFKKALEWFKKAAAAHGHYAAKANHWLGTMYNKGQGVKIDFKKAKQHWYAAADAGHAQAQVNIADLFKTGEKEERNDNVAFRYYSLAAEQGHVDAQFLCGDMYRQGLGGE